MRELATSGARLQLALAPAGTGKTTALRVLARAWTDAGGTVLGLAPSAQPRPPCCATARRPHRHPRQALPRRRRTDQLPALGRADRPGHPGRHRRGRHGRHHRARRAVAFVTGRGGSVRLVGDDQQLAAIGAGGVLRDIAHNHGAVTLSQVRAVHRPRRSRRLPGPARRRPGRPRLLPRPGRIHVGDHDHHRRAGLRRVGGRPRRRAATPSCSPPPASWSPS